MSTSPLVPRVDRQAEGLGGAPNFDGYCEVPNSQAHLIKHVGMRLFGGKKRQRQKKRGGESLIKKENLPSTIG